MAVQVQAVEDHVAEMAGELSVPRSQSCLQRLEVRLSLVVDDHHLSIQKQRSRETSERIGYRPEEVGEGKAVARYEPYVAVPDSSQDPKAVPLGLVDPIGGREHRVGLLKEHGCGVAWMWVWTTLV